MVRGATKQILDEAERSLHDALCVLSRTVKETKIVYGGGENGFVDCTIVHGEVRMGLWIVPLCMGR